MQTPSITRLGDIVNDLSEESKGFFKKIFDFSVSTGFLTVPDTFRDKMHLYFKQGEETPNQTIERVSSQTIVSTLNKYTLEGALFNELRTCKPGNRPEAAEKLRVDVFKYIDAEHAKRPCDLCKPKELTPLDLSRRIEKNGHITIANAAKYDATNGMIIFKNYNPLIFTEQDFSDWIDIASQWFSEVHSHNDNFVHPFLIWNCLPRAGASQMHGHMHTLLAKSPYAGIEVLRRASNEYRGYYFEDLASVHSNLGLGFENAKANIFAYLTPTKDKEVLVVAPSLNDLKKSTYEVARSFIDDMGVFAFNLGLQMPPIVSNPNWNGFPYISRIVDRGNPLGHGTDFAGMELFGSKVIGSDPFKVASVLKNKMCKA